MKNHFARTGLSPEADAEALRELSRTSPPDERDTLLAADRAAAHEILHDERHRTHYRRVHLQYHAMADALAALAAPDALDSYRWRERLVEFVRADEEIPEGQGSGG